MIINQTSDITNRLLLVVLLVRGELVVVQNEKYNKMTVICHKLRHSVAVDGLRLICLYDDRCAPVCL